MPPLLPTKTQATFTLSAPFESTPVEQLPFFLRYPRAVFDAHGRGDHLFVDYTSGPRVPTAADLQLIRASSPLEELSPPQQWVGYGFALLPETPDTVRIASRIHRLALAGRLNTTRASLLASSHQHVIAGGTVQTTWPPPGGAAGVFSAQNRVMADETGVEFRQIAMRLYAQLQAASAAVVSGGAGARTRRGGSSSAAANSRHPPSLAEAQAYFEANGLAFSGSKVLVTEPTHGAQPLHHDSDRYLPSDPDVSIIMYCSYTGSTYLPRSPLSARLLTPPPRFATDEEYDAYMASAVGQSESSRRASLLYAYYDRTLFHSIPVRPGQILFFRHSVLHAGAANLPLFHHPSPASRGLTTQRILAFDMIGRAVDAPSPAGQYFQWHPCRDSYGEKSREYLESLILADEEFGVENGATQRLPEPQTGAKVRLACSGWRYEFLHLCDPKHGASRRRYPDPSKEPSPTRLPPLVPPPRRCIATVGFQPGFQCVMSTSRTRYCEFHLELLFGVRIAPSQIITPTGRRAGLGVFAARDLPKGWRLPYSGDFTPSSTSEYLLQLDHPDVPRSECRFTLDASREDTGVGRYVNSPFRTGKAPNCYFSGSHGPDPEHPTGTACLLLTRTVPAGTELLVPYGTEYQSILSGMYADASARPSQSSSSSSAS